MPVLCVCALGKAKDQETSLGSMRVGGGRRGERGQWMEGCWRRRTSGLTGFPRKVLQRRGGGQVKQAAARWLDRSECAGVWFDVSMVFVCCVSIWVCVRVSCQAAGNAASLFSHLPSSLPVSHATTGHTHIDSRLHRSSSRRALLTTKLPRACSTTLPGV